MGLNLQRNSRLFISTVKTGNNATNTWRIPLLEGFSFTQSTSSSDVSADEAGATPRRGGKRFNDSVDPADWSFSTYIRPYALTGDENGSEVTRVYEGSVILWQALVAPTVPNLTDTNAPVRAGTDKFSVDFTDSNTHELLPLFLFFEVDNNVYLVEDASVNQAEISVDITGIAQVSWSGNGTFLTTLDSIPAWMASDTNYQQFPDTATYLRNKLSILDLSSNLSGSNVDYNIPITGGTVTINNNITYLTPSTLDKVDRSIGYFTGSLEVTGSLTAYLATSANGASTFLSNLQAFDAVTNSVEMSLWIGGKYTSGDKRDSFRLSMPTCHFSVPTVETGDIISTTMEFRAQGTSEQLLSGDEMVIEAYVSTV